METCFVFLLWDGIHFARETREQLPVLLNAARIYIDKVVTSDWEKYTFLGELSLLLF